MPVAQESSQLLLVRFYRRRTHQHSQFFSCCGTTTSVEYSLVFRWQLGCDWKKSQFPFPLCRVPITISALSFTGNVDPHNHQTRQYQGIIHTVPSRMERSYPDTLPVIFEGSSTVEPKAMNIAHGGRLWIVGSLQRRTASHCKQKTTKDHFSGLLFSVRVLWSCVTGTI